VNGGPIDLTAFGSVLHAVGVLYWVLALAALIAALWQPRRWWGKAVAVACVLAGFGWIPVHQGIEAYAAAKRLEESTSLFTQRCKAAGERIFRTVEDVDGVAWMKWRPMEPNQQDQFKLDDPYGQDCGGEDCIANLLRVTKGADLRPDVATRHSNGYQLVDATAPGQQSFRYFGVIKLRPRWTEEALAREKALTGKGIQPFDYDFFLEREPIAKWQARYGVKWEDISTQQDRAHWIAGSSLKVIDLQSNEVLAERVGYMMDRGQGSTAGFRQPWTYAVQNACPAFSHEPNDSRHGRTLHETRDFVLKVLRPNKGE
jgi:hypothetical protein